MDILTGSENPNRNWFENILSKIEWKIYKYLVESKIFVFEKSRNEKNRFQ